MMDKSEEIMEDIRVNENEKVKVLNVESGKRVRENALEKRIERKEGNLLLESENKKNEICNVEK